MNIVEFLDNESFAKIKVLNQALDDVKLIYVDLSVGELIEKINPSSVLYKAKTIPELLEEKGMEVDYENDIKFGKFPHFLKHGLSKISINSEHSALFRTLNIDSLDFSLDEKVRVIQCFVPFNGAYLVPYELKDKEADFLMNDAFFEYYEAYKSSGYTY